MNSHPSWLMFPPVAASRSCWPVPLRRRSETPQGLGSEHEAWQLYVTAHAVKSVGKLIPGLLAAHVSINHDPLSIRLNGVKCQKMSRSQAHLFLLKISRLQSAVPWAVLLWRQADTYKQRSSQSGFGNHASEPINLHGWSCVNLPKAMEWKLSSIVTRCMKNIHNEEFICFISPSYKNVVTYHAM